MMAPKLPARGFHPDLTVEQYLALRAVSNSWLGVFKQAPARLWALLNHPDKAERPDTAATRLGAAIHTAILEPDSFTAQYLKAGDCTAEIQSGVRQGQACGAPGKMYGPEEGWRCGKHKPLTWDSAKTVLSPDDWDTCMGLRDNALSKKAQFHNPRARKLLLMPGHEVELTGVWDDPETGEPCKLRGDHVADRVATCTDVKSTLDASPLGFPRTFYDRRYYAQQGHYGMGFNALGRPMQHHYIIAAEKHFPYLIAVYRIVDEVITLSQQEVRQLLDLYHQCVESGVWPGYPAQTMDLSLPYWGERQLRAALNLET